MSSFDIDVTRDGGRWTVHIREVNGPAQGRTSSEAEWTARQMIALATGVPIDDIAVRAAGLAALKTSSGQVGEQFVDPALLQRQVSLKRLPVYSCRSGVARPQHELR